MTYKYALAEEMSQSANLEEIHDKRESAEIFQFVPRADLDASELLAGFIQGCREQMTVFGKTLDWNSNAWDVTAYIPKMGRKGRSAFVFSNFDTAGEKAKITPMAQPFLDFAKSYMRYQQPMRRTKDFGKRLAALRALEKALVELSIDGIPRVEKTDPHTLNRAAQLILERMPKSAYQVGKQLQTISAFLVNKRLTAFTFTWMNYLKKPIDHNIRIGVDAAERRRSKLPSNESIIALGGAYCNASKPIDVIIASIVALLMSTPDRINEIFRLPVNCEVEKTNNDGTEEYGLRWWPSKGAEPMVKPVINTMVELAKQALQKLRTHTEEARRMALWYETNPGKIYLPRELEHLRSRELLLTDNVRQILGFSATSAISSWAKICGIEPVLESRSRTATGRSTNSYRFVDFERAVINLLPVGFPYMNKATRLKYSDALILVPKNLFHPNRGTYRCMFEEVTTDFVNDQLGSGTKHGKSSIFSRFGLFDENGTLYKITSHQFRHLLNTIAHKRFVDPLIIAKWSGRKNVSQNVDYDNRSSEEMLELLKEGDPYATDGAVKKFTPQLPVSIEHFMNMKFENVHVTPFGYCVLDWSIAPCDRVRACFDCTEHKCVKGDEKKNERMRFYLREAEEQLSRDEQAHADGFIGADKFLELNRRRVERLQSLVQLFDDPNIPFGQVIDVVNDNEYSPTRLAVAERRQLGDADAEMLNLVLSIKDAACRPAELKGE